MKVLITARAKLEIQAAHDWWSANRSASQAGRWYRGIYKAIATLRSKPDRHPLIAEHQHFSTELRQLNFGLSARSTHRVIFKIESDIVLVLAVRHLAQRQLNADDLD